MSTINTFIKSIILSVEFKLIPGPIGTDKSRYQQGTFMQRLNQKTVDFEYESSIRNKHYEKVQNIYQEALKLRHECDTKYKDINKIGAFYSNLRDLRDKNLIDSDKLYEENLHQHISERTREWADLSRKVSAKWDEYFEALKYADALIDHHLNYNYPKPIDISSEGKSGKK